MFTSDKEKTAFTYLIISIIVALFGAVYEYFSFGVWSAFMVYAFMVPLAGGALPFFLQHIMKTRRSASDGTPRTIALSLYHSALATLTLGSIIQGVLEICGRPNSLTIVYLIAGAALLTASAVTAAVQKKRDTRRDIVSDAYTNN